MIHREMTIDQLLESYPQKAQALAQVLSAAGLNCVGCQASTWETLEAGAYGYGLGEEELGELLSRLNGVLEGKEAPRDTITMTERAAVKYRAILEAEGKGDWGVRFAEKPGGCNGYEYVLDYSEKARDSDLVFESQGIEIHVPKAMLQHLLGSEIDYLDGLRGSGFKIANPNVRGSCGCGNSHSY